MTITDYIPLAMRTRHDPELLLRRLIDVDGITNCFPEMGFSKGRDPVDLFVEENTPRVDIMMSLLHGIVGIGGEFFELEAAVAKQDWANVFEELGDFTWYNALLLNIPVAPMQNLRRAIEDRDAHVDLDTIETAQRFLFEYASRSPNFQALKLLQSGVSTNSKADPSAEAVSYVRATGCLLLDTVKRIFFYGTALRFDNPAYAHGNILQEDGKPVFLDCAVAGALWSVFHICNVIAATQKSDEKGWSSCGRVMDMNIEKLKRRYAKKFTETEAETRNLEKERSVFESPAG